MRVLLLRALGATLAFAIPLAGAWALALYFLGDRPDLLRWVGIGIYTVALIASVRVGRHLRRG